MRFFTKTKLLPLLLLSLLGVTHANAANLRYPSVAEMVADQQTIRVLFDNGGNYGNQSASVNVMNRLWKMHFQGTFEVIYPDHEYGSRDQIIDLFNLPKNLPPVYDFTDSQQHHIIFYGESAYIKALESHAVKPIALGITGAHDAPAEWVCKTEETACEPVLYEKNFANFTRAKVFVELQPWFYSPQKDSFDIQGDAQRHKVDPHGKYLVFPVATLDDAKNYLKNTVDGQQFLAKAPATTALLAGINSKAFNLMPVYGWALKNEQSTDHYPENIMHVLSAARFAQLQGQGQFFLSRPGKEKIKKRGGTVVKIPFFALAKKGILTTVTGPQSFYFDDLKRISFQL